MLQTPGQCHRADDGAQGGHGQQARHVSAAQARFTAGRLAQRQADQRGACVQQGGRGKRTQPPAKVLHQRRAQAKQQRRQQGQKTATQGG